MADALAAGQPELAAHLPAPGAAVPLTSPRIGLVDAETQVTRRARQALAYLRLGKHQVVGRWTH